jgi:hypothetical protein
VRGWSGDVGDVSDMSDVSDVNDTTGADRAFEPYAMQDPFDPVRPRVALGARLRAFAVICVCAVLMALVVSGGLLAYGALKPPDVSAYEGQGIAIGGLADKDFIVTPATLMQLDCTGAAALGSGSGQAGESKAGTVKAYGPYLADFVAQYGYELGDFRRIKVYCKDGYSTILRPELLEGKPILSVAAGKEALSLYQRPLRLVIPGEATGKWAFGILRMEFER